MVLIRNSKIVKNLYENVILLAKSKNVYKKRERKNKKPTSHHPTSEITSSYTDAKCVTSFMLTTSSSPIIIIVSHSLISSSRIHGKTERDLCGGCGESERCYAKTIRFIIIAAYS